MIRGVDLVGAAIQNRFEREDKDGVISRYGFSIWYNGSVRTTAYFHNIIGILTEATHDSPSPHTYDLSRFPERFRNGWPSREPSVSYSRPWKGGELHFRDALDYMLTASLAVLEIGAKYREEFLFGIYQMGARQIEKGRTEAPVAYVISSEQHDPPAAATFIETLMKGAVEVHQAEDEFETGARKFPSRSYVIRMDQPFRPFAKDMLEPQHYPDVRTRPDAPPIPPYDNAGWTLSYQMGVDAVAIDEPFDANLVLLETHPRVQGKLIGKAGFGYAIHPNTNNSSIATNRLLEGGYRVARTLASLEVDETRLPAGALVVESTGDLKMKLGEMSRELGIEVTALSSRPRVDTFDLRPLRVGVYKSWVTEWVDNYTAAEGWTRWVLDQYEFPYETLHNRDVRSEDLRSRYDVIVIPNQKAEDIVGGYRPGRRQFGIVHQALPPPEYQGGIEEDGIQALGQFVKNGGTLLLIDQACDLVTDRMGVPVRSELRDLPNEQFFGPGSIVRILIDPSHPVGHGMPETGAAYFRKSRTFELDDPSVKSVVRYANTDVLMSGWILGEEHLAGKHAVVEVPLGEGRIILFGFPPYFRGQPHGTFKLFFNALYYGSAMANDGIS